ncbi:MAG: dTDP-glucose 4,6-dehydratase [Chloracidobacterium sp.]|uniref:dTDP-glucose 4,6-dehydratase n=1 Tax=Chloracidobacterium validum TaxID=2821543 RepID=A0ABX8BB94_9BACT|nr:dTDP-glucose 4,6-dehydratase [Chloracidobacterium validum]QUW03677.1 dTDP-glucose 4,6-dehydratase [Chloracidobacterium validum]
MAMFITGGAGFIGSAFIRSWVKRYPNDTVINFDKLTYAGNLDNLAEVADQATYQFVRGDICDAAALRAAIPDGCDAIVHFAAESHVDRSILSAREFILTNVLGTQTLLDVAREKGVKRFLHISTDEVGGSVPEDQFFAEDGPLAPSSPYAASKAAAEHLVRAAAHTFGLNALITRTSNNYGPYQFPEKLIPLALTNALADRPIPVYGDGQQVRDWIHVDDNCAALRLVLEKGQPGATYHIGGRSPLPNRTVLTMLLELLGKPTSLLTEVTDRLGHDRRYAVDCSKIERELGWRPQVAFREGLAQTIAWYQNNPVWVARARSGEYRTYYAQMYGAL